MTTIQSQIDQVLALAEKATPGPWGACNQDKGGCICGGVYSVSEDMGVAGTGSILEDLFCGNREEDADKIAANAVLIAQAVNFLREHGHAIRAAVGGEAVAWWDGGDRVINRAAKEAGARSGGATASATSAYSIPLYASPTATVDVGAIVALCEKFDGWVRELAEDPDASNAIEGQAIQACRAELAALIGKEA